MTYSGEDAYARMRACAMQRESAQAYLDARESADNGSTLAVAWQKLAAVSAAMSRMNVDWLKA